jgi:hypothetical protein
MSSCDLCCRSLRAKTWRRLSAKTRLCRIDEQAIRSFFYSIIQQEDESQIMKRDTNKYLLMRNIAANNNKKHK